MSGKGCAVKPSARYSTLQDLDAGRHTEIDMFSGALIRMGRELGIPTPYNEFAYHMIKALEEKKTHDTWQEGFLNIFEAVLANKPFVMNVYRCVDRAQVEKYLKPLTDNLLMGVIDERAEGITVREEDKEFIARVYSYVFIGIMLDWIKDDMKADPKLIVDKLAILMKDSLADALRRFRI